MKFNSISLKRWSLIRLLAVSFIAASFVISLPVSAADFPQKGKVIQIIVPYGAGGSSDVGSRILASGLEKELGTSVIIVNKPGANGQIGWTALSKANPDGYTIGNTNFPGMATSYLVKERQALYSRSSFQPLALHVFDPSIFAVKANSPYKNIKDLVKAAKANPKKLTIASGILNDAQFGILQFQKLAGIELVQVTFADGSASAMAAFLGGKVDVFCGNIGDMLAQYKSGEVRILGIMDSRPSAFYPGVKTFKDQGYNLSNGSARGFSVPAGTPKNIVKILGNAIQKVVATPEHKKRLADMALTLKYMDDTQFTKYWADYEKMVTELLPLTK